MYTYAYRSFSKMVFSNLGLLLIIKKKREIVLLSPKCSFTFFYHPYRIGPFECRAIVQFTGYGQLHHARA